MKTHTLKPNSVITTIWNKSNHFNEAVNIADKPASLTDLLNQFLKCPVLISGLSGLLVVAHLQPLNTEGLFGSKAADWANIGTFGMDRREKGGKDRHGFFRLLTDSDLLYSLSMYISKPLVSSKVT